MDFELYTLQNGIKIAHKRVNSPVAYCCIMVNAGTRDELDSELGIAHFIEHVIFKGTKKRKAYHIMSRLENVGGELNAYTAKEETVVHATFLKQDFQRAFELLADIVFRSTFPDKEIQKEKDVVIDEINSYKDNPAELIFDDFEEMIFSNHPFGHNILGTKKMVKSFNKKNITSFMERNYNTDQIIFCSIGDIPFLRVQKLAERYLSWVSANPRRINRTPVGIYIPQNKVLRKSTHQTHCIIGAPAFNLFDDRRYALFLLNDILGGPGMNSRLNIALREKHGYAYNVESNYQPYTDTGLVTIYFGTDKDNLLKAQQLILKEIELFKTQALGTMQLAKAKRQLIGQLAIAAESNEATMISAAKGFLVYNTPDDLQETFSHIEDISAKDLMEVANQVFEPQKLSTLIYK